MRYSAKCRFGLACLLLVCGSGFRDRPKPADLVLHNGTIITLDKTRPRAQAIAARGDRIIAVGSDEFVKRWIGPKTRVIDLNGKPPIRGLLKGTGIFFRSAAR
ncbi:MAG: hypothetical protein IID45_14750 [Planctomycetes bacterium]|nr:hypothetical protein [Planctomycetota bacterium]